jgi:hypothetical protein
MWRVEKTFNTLQEAQAYADANKQSNAREDFYRVQIKAHQKILADLMTPYNDTVIKFSDGTTATW